MAAPPTQSLYAAPFHRLEPLVGDLLRRLAGDDPLRPRRLVVISNLVRDRLQERLAAGGAIAGVSFLTMRDLAREVGEAALLEERRRPLPPEGGAALAGRVLAGAAGALRRLRPPAGAEGYGEALFATLTDLAEGDLGPADLDALAGRLASRADREWTADLARLARAFEEALRALGFYDDGLLFRAACAEAEARPPAVPTLLYGFAEMNARQRRLVAACCRGAACAALVPAEEGAPACAFARPLIAWFRARGFRDAEVPPAGAARPFEALGRRLFGRGEEAGEAPAAPALISAPAQSREAFEACREILHAGDGEAGVILPGGGEAYRRLFGETLRSLGVPADAGRGARLAGTPAGRGLLRMLALRERGYPRAEVMRFLDEGRFAETEAFRALAAPGDEAAAALLPARWEYLTRGLPYLSGEAGWRDALRAGPQRIGDSLGSRAGPQRIGDSLGSRAAEAEGEEAEGMEADRALAGGLSRAVALLFDRLGGLPARALPSAHAGAAAAAFSELTGEVEGRREVLAALSGLGGLDPILGAIGAAEFRRWARSALERAVLPPPRGPARVRLLSMQEARGLSFGTVAVPGLAEGIFPARAGEDPLLPDGLRLALSRLAEEGEDLPPRLPPKGSRTAEDRHLLWLALLSAERGALLSLPLRGGGGLEDRERPPSLFLHHVAAALGLPAGGGPPANRGFAGLPGGGDLLAGFPGHRAATAALDAASLRARPVSLLEGDLAGMLGQLARARPERGALAHLGARAGFARRRAALAERWRRDALTPHDGMLAGPEAAAALRGRLDPARGTLAVTAVETFFKCPYRFALGRVLGLGDRPEPAPPLAADGALRGRLFHGALQRFFDGMRGAAPGAAEGAARRAALAGAVEAVFRRAEAEGRALYPLPWRLLREEVESELDAFLRAAYPAGAPWRPVRTEGAFGRERPPLAVPLGERTLLLAGRYDLLETDGAGGYRFVDFKSGRAPKKKEPLGGGERLQVHLYARRGRGDLGPDARVGGAYAYVTGRGGREVRESGPEAIEQQAPAVDALLGFFAEACGRAAFFPLPEKTKCGHCDFVTLCGPDRNERADRKAGDPLRARLDALKGEAP